MDLSRSPNHRAVRLVCLFLVSRLALLAVGLMSVFILPSAVGSQPGNLVWHRPAPAPLEIWARWDSEWYLLIASEGYAVGETLAELGLPYSKDAAAGFLPLYPMLIRVLSPLFDGVAAGVIISNLCLFVSLLLLDRLVRLETGTEAGESAALVACTALLLHPSSLFLSAVYAESLFLVLSIGAFLGARTGRFGVAGVLGGLAALTRPFGVLLVMPLAWEWWKARGEADETTGKSARLLSGLWILLVPAAMVGYMLFTRSIFGDPLALLHRQEKWRGGLSGPWRAFIRWWEAGPVVHGAHGSTFELIVALTCLALLAVMARKLRPSYTIYAASAVVLALGSTLWSFSRLTLTLFPFFMLAGMAWMKGRRCLPTFYAFVGGAVGSFLMVLFANWWWAG
ncbi:MAG: hypothetical protein LJE93_01675 [Acidobacteria bacterium]|nr:hypothetical protein [Acidobacteriota bacterium]